jgi:hypothetical protein
MDSAELRVPTLPVQVTLVLVGGRRETVMLYLAAGSPTHDGPESLEEFLNRAGAFLPVRLSTGDSAMIARDALLEVLAASDAAPNSGAGIPNLDIIRVQLREGPEIEGVIRHVDPDERSRLSDHFNNPERFLAIASGEEIHYVNKHHVLVILV